MNRLSAISVVLLCLSVLLPAPSAGAEDAARSSAFIVAPVAGWTTNKADYPAGPPGRKKTLKEDGPLGGIFLMYADDDLCVGNLGHYSNLDQSQVMSYMFFVRYYPARYGTFRPMVGLTTDYIDIHSSIPLGVRPPLSMDMVNTVWAFQPTIGVSWEYKSFRAVPFVGYFNERVKMDLYSPGMPRRFEVNETLEDQPEQLNSDPYGAWIVKVRPADVSELDSLMDAAAYEAFVNEVDEGGH